MNNKIKITVSGAAGTGKSTVADILMTFLKKNDFNVTHTPMEELDWVQRAENRDKRFAACRERCEIEIVEMMAPRSSINED